MEAWLNSMLKRIAEGSLLPAAYFGELDLDAALDSRDRDDTFDANWIRVSQEVERRWSTAVVAEHLRALAETVRRESFMAVSKATRQHEIASYVSDDFDLIVRARLVGLAEPLLDELWHAYDGGKFPIRMKR